MINNIKLSGFKSFSLINIPIKPLTLFSGLNNSGKSSVIQSLRMYEKAFNNKSPLLDGHGSLNEIRSKFVSANSPIDIELTFSNGNNELLRLSQNEKEQHKPLNCPLISYVSADRLGPQSFLPLNVEFSKYPSIGEHGEFVLDFIDKLSFSIVPKTMLHDSSEGDTLPLAIKGWLNEISPNIAFEYKLNPRADIAQATVDEFRPKNVGFGISYTLPIIATILGHTANAPDKGWDIDWGEQWDATRNKAGTLLLIENPEAHLHPRGQTAMGILLALAAKNGVQIIVETHSDHLMDGIRLACKNGDIQPEDIAFHFLSKENVNTESIIETPNITKDGKLDFWPNGFFDQTLKNRAKLARK